MPKDSDYDVVSIGYPGPVDKGRPVAEPRNLAEGWVGFDFVGAFGRPVRIKFFVSGADGRTRFSLARDTRMADPGAQAFRHSCSPHLCMKFSLDLNAVSDYMDKEMAFGF